MSPSVRLGVDKLLDDPNLIPGSNWGLITNYTGVTSDMRLSSTALAGSGLAALLSPEHGLTGTAQAGESEKGGEDPRTGLPVLDTYRLEGSDLDRAISDLGVDALVVDLADIGARFYTYVWTMVDCLRSAARLGLPFVVADRPNPLGGYASGPGLDPAYQSFIGRINVPIRHGLTIGELARVAASLDRADGLDVPDPIVVPMDGWTRSMMWADTGLPWVMPSPNIPTPDSAFAFVGTALFEGTNVSEGRGTTRPFELVGAPWLDPSYAEGLNGKGLTGARFRFASFNPIFSKWAGTPIGGAQVYLERGADPLAVGLAMLAGAVTEEFEWREPIWEGPRAGLHFTDLMWGGPGLREKLAADPGELLQDLDASELRARDAEWLLYPDTM